MNTKNFFTCSVILGLFIALQAGSAMAAVKTGQPAPNFSATTFEGQKMKLADYRGEVLLINIWATWCAPCKKELPLLDSYYRAQKKYGFRVLAVTTEDSLPAARLKSLQAALGINLAKNFRGPYTPIKGMVPSNYIVDRNGVVRYAQAGSMDLDTLNAEIVPLLQESGKLTDER